jgi:Bacterial SH3 domain
MQNKLILGLLLAASATATQAVPAKQFPPRDECLAMDGYFDMRQNFESIVKRRDSKAFLAMVSPAISWSFGGGEGKAEFAKEWKLETGKASPIWAELDQIVRLGCVTQGADAVVMPHLFGQDPGTGDAGAGNALVLGPAVNVRAEPSTSSASLRKLNWEVVQTAGMDSSEKWTKIKSADGKGGYIRNDYLRGFLDYRIGFERKEKGWVVSFFIAGD